jgi:hypothetical protein
VRIPTRSLPALLLVLALMGAACTGDDPSPSPSDTTDTGSPLPTEDVPVDFVPGEWTYENNGVTVAFSWEGGTLSVENGSGAELGPPGLYVVSQTQERFDAEVAETGPIPDGDAAGFVATFPDGLTLKDVGLVVLLFGDQNWGALSPVAIEE